MGALKAFKLRVQQIRVHLLLNHEELENAIKPVLSMALCCLMKKPFYKHHIYDVYNERLYLITTTALAPYRCICCMGNSFCVSSTRKNKARFGDKDIICDNDSTTNFSILFTINHADFV